MEIRVCGGRKLHFIDPSRSFDALHEKLGQITVHRTNFLANLSEIALCDLIIEFKLLKETNLLQFVVVTFKG